MEIMFFFWINSFGVLPIPNVKESNAVWNSEIQKSKKGIWKRGNCRGKRKVVALALTLIR